MAVVGPGVLEAEVVGGGVLEGLAGISDAVGAGMADSEVEVVVLEAADVVWAPALPGDPTPLHPDSTTTRSATAAAGRRRIGTDICQS